MATGEIYHIFNRGIERRDIFTRINEYRRALEVIGYYRYSDLPVKFSLYLKLPDNQKSDILKSLEHKNKLEVKLIAFCLMPNHFHLLVRQEKDGGISRFVSNFSNSYCKYFNTKYERVGPLFQGSFKAVRVETDEQLIHLSRYIHLNPVSSCKIKEKDLDDYPWSSMAQYLGKIDRGITDSSLVMSNFKNAGSYRKFVHDQVSYAKELEKIKHLLL